MINEVTNNCGKRDILLTHYQACEILGITVQEIRELVQKVFLITMSQICVVGLK